MTLSLGWLPEAAYAYLLLFARIGSFLMLAPALGEDTIPQRMRLSFALALTLMFYPLVSPLLPPMPGEMSGIVVQLLRELAVGLVLGAISRLLVSATQIAGSIIAFQSGLSAAMTADPSQGGIQGAVFGSFLSFLGIALIFATDLHHMIVAAVYESYVVFDPNADLMIDDAVEAVIRSVAGAFALGVQMAAPFIVFGLVFNLGAGILARLMPQLQVYFILMPLNIFVGLLLLALLLTMMMGWYLTAFEGHFAMLFG
jgi:flagellar biosynthetic protein FliR